MARPSFGLAVEVEGCLAAAVGVAVRAHELSKTARKLSKGGGGASPMTHESPALAGLSEERMMGLEPTTFCMASRRSSQLSYIRVGVAV